MAAAESILQLFMLAGFCGAGVPPAVFPIIMNRKNADETPPLLHAIRIGAGMMASAPIQIFMCVVNLLAAWAREERVW